MAKDINDSFTLGLRDDEAFEIFDKRGLKKDYGELLNDEFDPYFPSKGTIQAFEDLSRRTGQADSFIEAEPILNQMFNAFYNLRLSEPWTFKLEDFIPSLAPQSRVPLPPQPQPNPSIVQQPTPMQTGLTPAEQALLSEEEKMIRLRNRGLA